MSKDHSTSDFGRPSGYKSDIERAETDAMTKSVNTSFGSRNHNVYIMRKDHTHEHFYYNPADSKSGWHGHLWRTKNNQPQTTPNNANSKGDEQNMENSYLEGLKVDMETQARINEVSQRASERAKNPSSKNSDNDGDGRQIGDSSGSSHRGRENAYKEGSTSQTSSNEGQSGQSSSSPAAGGHNGSSSNSGHGTASAGGHSSGAVGCGGHSGGKGGH